MMESLSLEYVERNKTKRASRGFKVMCPSCGGKDLWITTNNARGFCFECGVTYQVGEAVEDREEYTNTQSFNIPEIRKVYKEAVDFYTECLDVQHKCYLHQRGIDSNAITDFAIGYCPDSSMPLYKTSGAKEAGLSDRNGSPWLANRVVFPYFADGYITDIRGRTLTDDTPRYKSLYHKSAARGALYPFNYDRAMNMAHKSRFVILTEGEIKAIVSDLHGFPTVALPGMLSWRPGFITDPSIRVTVIFDNSYNPDDRLRIDKAIARIARRLPIFYVATLPLLGEQKMDIDSFLLHKKGGPDRFHAIIDSAVDYDRYCKLRRF